MYLNCISKIYIYILYYSSTYYYLHMSFSTLSVMILLSNNVIYIHFYSIQKIMCHHLIRILFIFNLISNNRIIIHYYNFIVLLSLIKLVSQGFRKIHSHRWEFANEKFQRGKKHLLKSIRRRSRACVDLTKSGLEAELESLRDDQSTMRFEILKLRQQQEDSQNQITAVEERIRCAECKQQQMLSFFAKVSKYPKFVRQLIHKRKQQREFDGGEISKRRRLLAAQEAENFPESVICRNQTHQKLASMQSELTDMKNTPFPGAMDGENELCSHMEDLKGNLMGETSEEDASLVYRFLVGSLLGDNSVLENMASEELAVNDTQIFHELEDLIEKPCGWPRYVTELVELEMKCMHGSA